MYDKSGRVKLAELLIRKYPKILKKLENELNDKFEIYWNQHQILDIPNIIEKNKSHIATYMSSVNEITEENKKLMEEWLTKYEVIQNQIVGFEDDLPKYELPIKGDKTNAEIMKIIKKNKPNIKEVSHENN
jgi:hypothetical protein